MHALIDAAFSRNRTTLLSLLFVMVAGIAAYAAIPKEADPDVAIPLIYVSMSHDGISPEDAERLLIRPMEKELQSIEGLKEMTGTASEGHGSILLEFDAGFDAQKALDDVREKVDIAKSQLPADTDEPVVQEVNVALFPVLTVALSGPVPERTLLALARDLRERIEALPGVLQAEIGGDREEVLEVLVDPLVLETYGIRFEQLFDLITRNNRLVAAGALDTGSGRMVVKVPGVIEQLDDVLGLPVKAVDGTVVTFKDVATLRRTFKDPEGFARINGQPAITLEIKKRIGANIIETIEAVRGIVAEQQKLWPNTVRVDYLQDQSRLIRDMLGDLENNVLSAILLVMVVVLATLGLRSALLVGLAIPVSFVAGILVLHALGYTLNIVTLFSLILVVGMLVDGAIVVTEYADRRMVEGHDPVEAYRQAARRMAWPVISSTATTLAVFVPLLFWPGVVGQFMKYLPLTVLVTLSASLIVALVFTPVLGGLIGKAGVEQRQQLQSLLLAERGDLRCVKGATGAYLRLLGALLRHPGKTLSVTLLFIVGVYVAYGRFGHGVEFFPEVEPEFAQVQVHARGDLSIWEKDALLRQVEQRLLDMPEFKSVYSRSFNQASGGREMAEDVIGVLQLEFVPWRQRRPAKRILVEVQERIRDLPGIIIETLEAEQGPSAGKPIQLQLSARDPDRLAPTVARLRRLMERIGGFKDIEDSRPLPGIEWRLVADREQAARYGADIATLGNAVQLITNGIKVADYRPNDSDKEVDIRVRYPLDTRSLDRLDQLRAPTDNGMVPIGNFVRFEPAPKTGTLTRIDSQRAMTLKADVAEGVLVDNQVKALRAALEAQPQLLDGVTLRFKGEEEDQRKTMVFLVQAFLAAIFLMVIILVTQFNSLYQTLLVMSAIVLSTAGVLLGLLATGQPFGIVMGGIGVIALAGIVVNNNIVLIDTYNDLRHHGMAPVEAALRSCAQRLRPVLLTSVTTVLGLMPMVLAVNIDLIDRDIALGAPSTQWWTQLSSTIAGGMTFATLLTLLLTPCLLVAGERVLAWRKRRRRPTTATPNHEV
ncbi:MAG TPA: efflux RND transporter permease subunit [Candidatus Competibacteraceae bacterium]|nr:efflux RND transporter permease subunit [Candidatus Competibacteraceae bacterium]